MTKNQARKQLILDTLELKTKQKKKKKKQFKMSDNHKRVFFFLMLVLICYSSAVLNHRFMSISLLIFTVSRVPKSVLG